MSILSLVKPLAFAVLYPYIALISSVSCIHVSVLSASSYAFDQALVWIEFVTYLRIANANPSILVPATLKFLLDEGC